MGNGEYGIGSPSSATKGEIALISLKKFQILI